VQLVFLYTILGSVAVVGAGLAIVGLKRRLSKTEAVALPDVILLIEVPKFNEKGPVAAEMMFASLHGLLKETPTVQEHFSFEIVASEEGIKFYAVVPQIFENFVKSQIYAQYPQAEISRVEDYTKRVMSDRMAMAATEVVLAREYYFPIKTFPNFEVDPLAAITSAVEDLPEGSQAWLQLLIRPLPDIWQKAGYQFVDSVRQGTQIKPSLFSGIKQDLGLAVKEIIVAILSLIPEIITSLLNPNSARYTGEGARSASGSGKVELSAEQRVELEGVENKLTKLGFETSIRIVGSGKNLDVAAKQVDSVFAALRQFSTAHLNSFERSEFVRSVDEVVGDYRRRVFPSKPDNIFILNTEELASLFHLPNVTVETPNIAWTKAKKVEYPLDLPVGVKPIIGATSFRDSDLKFGIKRDDRRRHMYIIGKTGTGKSTLLESMIVSDIEEGEGLAVLDPHGDSFEKLLNYIPEERLEDVVIFDPSDLQFPVAMNMLELFDPDQIGLVASGLVDVFRRRFEFSWGPRLEHILRNCLLTLLHIPHSTLLGVTRLLTDRAYRKYITHLLPDPVLKDFWEVEFEGMADSKSLVAEAISPIQNRLGQFLSTPTIRNIVGQPRSTIKLDEIINTRKILLVNLSKGKIGEDNSAILGGMLISRLQFAAMTRVSLPPEERKDFFVYVDEFQNFATSAFASILSEARKYRLNLILAHQYLAQVPEEVRTAIFGNVGSIISFSVGQADASILAKEFAPTFDESDLIGLEKYHIYLKLMIDLSQSRPFSARTLPFDVVETGLREKVIASSRSKYAADRSEVESRIVRWSRKQFVPGMDDKVVEKLRKELETKAAAAKKPAAEFPGEQNP